MDYLKLLDELLKFSIGSISVSAVIIFVSKKFIDQWLAQRVEVHKVKLDKDVEKYKFNLQRISNEHSIRFSKLHEERAEVIKEAYSRLNDTEISIRILVQEISKQSSSPSILENYLLKSNEDIHNFVSFTNKNRILFSRNVCS